MLRYWTVQVKCGAGGSNMSRQLAQGSKSVFTVVVKPCRVKWYSDEGGEVTIEDIKCGCNSMIARDTEQMWWVWGNNTMAQISGLTCVDLSADGRKQRYVKHPVQVQLDATKMMMIGREGHDHAHKTHVQIHDIVPGWGNFLVIL